jgi:hypothetical protein
MSCEKIESDPQAIWPFVARWGSHPQADLRAAIATCLLEHLLEYHFKMIFPRVRRIAKAKELFADTFARCAKFGQSELRANSEKFDKLKTWCSLKQKPNRSLERMPAKSGGHRSAQGR